MAKLNKKKKTAKNKTWTLKKKGPVTKTAGCLNYSNSYNNNILSWDTYSVGILSSPPFYIWQHDNKYKPYECYWKFI